MYHNFLIKEVNHWLFQPVHDELLQIWQNDTRRKYDVLFRFIIGNLISEDKVGTTDSVGQQTMLHQKSGIK